MNEQLLSILLLVNACGWLITLGKYRKLINWLKEQAPMTWETYQRLGK